MKSYNNDGQSHPIDPDQVTPNPASFIIQIPQHYKCDKTGYPSPLHNIHVQPFLSSEESAHCLQLAVMYGRDKWQTPNTERHTNYATCDFTMEEAPDLMTYLSDIDFQRRIFQRLSQSFHVHQDHLLGFMDLFCVNYVAANKGHTSVNDDDDDHHHQHVNIQTMDRLGAHRDGSILSFTVLLTPPDQFEGGGTFFDALQDEPPKIILSSKGVVRPPKDGYVVLHSGKLLHGADVVTQGQRTVLVGFVDLADWCIRPGIERQASTSFGRLDVAHRRAQLQFSMSQGGSKRSWLPNCSSARFLPNACCLNTIIPFLDTAMSRADPGYQRRVRLQTEDLMLRKILCEEASEHYDKESPSEDITIV